MVWLPEVLPIWQKLKMNSVGVIKGKLKEQE